MKLLLSSAIVACGLAWCTPARAQQPTPPGNFNFYVFADAAPGGGQQLNVLQPDLSGGTPSFTISMTGTIANTLRRRAQSFARLEAQPLIVTDGGGSGGLWVVVPTIATIGGVRTLLLEAADFRTGVPPACGSPTTFCTTTLTLATTATGTIDYDFLQSPIAGEVFCQISVPGVGTTVNRVFFGTTGPTVTASVFFPQQTAPYVTRMLYVYGRLWVPLLNGLGVITAPSAPTIPTSNVTTIAMPARAANGVQYQIGTNLNAGFPAGSPQDIVFGLRQPGTLGGHRCGYVNVSAGGVVTTNFGADDPFGAGQILAPGENEVFVHTPGATTISSFLVSAPQGVLGAGAVGLLSGGIGALTTTSTTLAFTPIGNIEGLRASAGNTLTFVGVDASGAPFFFACDDSGVTTPPAISAPSAIRPPGLPPATLVFFNTAAADRPFNLRGGSDFFVSFTDNSGGPNDGLLTFSVTPGVPPTVSAPVVTLMSGPATTVPNLVLDPNPFSGSGPLAVGAQGFFDPSGANVNDVRLIVGAPLAIPPTSFPFDDPTPNAAIPFAPVLNVVLPVPSTIAALGSRQPQFNFSPYTVPGSSTPWMAIPGDAAAGGFGNVAFHNLLGGAPVIYFNTTGGLASVIAML